MSSMTIVCVLGERNYCYAIVTTEGFHVSVVRLGSGMLIMPKDDYRDYAITTTDSRSKFLLIIKILIIT